MVGSEVEREERSEDGTAAPLPSLSYENMPLHRDKLLKTGAL